MEKMKAKPQLTLTEALKEAMGKLTVMGGRSRRSEYWWCALVLGLGSYFLGFIPILGTIISLAVLLVMIPLSVRRLHDTGHSGWWYGAAMLLGCAFTGALTIKILPIIEKYGESNVEKLGKKLVEAYSDPLVLGLMLASMVMGLVLLVFFCKDSKPEPNKWGPSPKYGTDEEEIEVIG